MTKADVIKFFGSQSAVAKALGVSKQAVGSWGEQIPEGRAYQIQVITGGKLKVSANQRKVA